MKVNFKKYRSYFGPYQFVEKIFFWEDREEIRFNTEDYTIGDKVAEWYANTWLGKIHQDLAMKWVNAGPKHKIVIEDHDTWSMDFTLANIASPMLKQLKDAKAGSPCVDDEDVPEGIRSTDDKRDMVDGHIYGCDRFFHDRWAYVIDEMIFAMENIVDEKWYDDMDKHKAHQKRIDNGCRLFGKYFRNLWT